MRESNARTRAVQAALNGTGPALPGSYAANPVTNARAMKDAEDDGCVGKCPKKKNKKDKLDKIFGEGKKAQKPNYSFDKWLKDVESLEDNIGSMNSDEKKKDADLDKKSKSLPKSTPDHKDSERSELWQSFKSKKETPDKETQEKKDDKKPPEKKPDVKPTNSAKNSSKSPSPTSSK